MKLCIAGYNNRVATLFEHAQDLLFYEYKDAQLRSASSIAAPSGGPAAWIGLLLEHDTQLLICGGLCRHTQRLLGSTGMDVASWICGSVDAVLDAFARDSLADCLMPGAHAGHSGCGGQGACGGRREGRGQHTCHGRGNKASGGVRHS